MNTYRAMTYGAPAPRRPRRRGLLWLLIAVGAIGSLVLCLVTAVVAHGILDQLAQAAQIPPPKYGETTQRNVAYGPLAGETLDLCTPVGAKTPRPGVIFIHGGGWTTGDKSSYDNACATLAKYGFVSATINYRLAPTSVWPAQIVDSQLAVRWLRAHATQFNFDPQRLCAWGDSAGAHLSVYLGVSDTIHPGDEQALYANQSPHATCVVDSFGPVNLTTLNTGAGVQALSLLFGATYQAAPDRYRDGSPLFLVSPQSAPMLIIQGTHDTVVPPSQSLALQAALQRNHVPEQYVSYDGGHSYSGLSQSQIQGILITTFKFLVAQEHP